MGLVHFSAGEVLQGPDKVLWFREATRKALTYLTGKDIITLTQAERIQVCRASCILILSYSHAMYSQMPHSAAYMCLSAHSVNPKYEKIS